MKGTLGRSFYFMSKRRKKLYFFATKFCRFHLNKRIWPISDRGNGIKIAAMPYHASSPVSDKSDPKMVLDEYPDSSIMWTIFS